MNDIRNRKKKFEIKVIFLNIKIFPYKIIFSCFMRTHFSHSFMSTLNLMGFFYILKKWIETTSFFETNFFFFKIEEKINLFKNPEKFGNEKYLLLPQ